MTVSIFDGIYTIMVIFYNLFIAIFFM